MEDVDTKDNENRENTSDAENDFGIAIIDTFIC